MVKFFKSDSYLKNQATIYLHMDGILSKLLSFPPHPPPPNPLSDCQYDESIREKIESVRALPKTALLQRTSGGEHVLDVGSYTTRRFDILMIALGYQSGHKYCTIYFYTTRHYFAMFRRD